MKGPVRVCSEIQNRLEKLLRCIDVNSVTGLNQGRDLGLPKNLMDQWRVIIFNVVRAAAADE
jgi:hypothetical protein